MSDIVYGEKYNQRALEWDMELDKERTKDLIKDINETLKGCENRFYLCSNEIDLDERLIGVKFGEDVLVLINPIYQTKEDMKLVREIDYETGKEYIMPRYHKVIICYQDVEGENKACRFDNDAAIVLSQAMDCIEGIHPGDYGLEIMPEFDEASKEEQQELIDYWLNSLKEKFNKYDEELSLDEESNKYWMQYKYNEAVDNGTVEISREVDTSNLNHAQRRWLKKVEKKILKAKNKAQRGK